MKNIVKSLLVHSILVILIIKGKNAVIENQPGNVVKVSIENGRDKEGNIEGHTIFLSNTKGDKKCDFSYEGIGISTAPLDNMVVDVSPDSPADRAGIQVGDIVLSPTSVSEMRGEKGTKVTVMFTKSNGSVVSRTITRDKICYAK